MSRQSSVVTLAAPSFVCDKLIQLCVLGCYNTLDILTMNVDIGILYVQSTEVLHCDQVMSQFRFIGKLGYIII